METRGATPEFVSSIDELGCEYALSGEHRMKLVMQDGIEVRDLYRIAANNNVQIRRLNFKRDSLEDIFLKAME
jgi:ABC-2 type transport system ATP-binding protein